MVMKAFYAWPSMTSINYLVKKPNERKRQSSQLQMRAVQSAAFSNAIYGAVMINCLLGPE
jgi:hypothetical protein